VVSCSGSSAADSCVCKLERFPNEGAYLAEVRFGTAVLWSGSYMGAQAALSNCKYKLERIDACK
jgi:hypothetical protein